MLQVLGRHIIRVGYSAGDNDDMIMMKLMMILMRETMRLMLRLMVLLLLLLLIVGFSVILINLIINFIISSVSSNGKMIMRFPSAIICYISARKTNSYNEIRYLKNKREN